MKTLSTTLIQARALIAHRSTWTQHYLARTSAGEPIEVANPAACSFCAIGALWRVTRMPYLTGRASHALHKAAQRLFQMGITDVNDRLGHAAVVRVYDDAIATARIAELRG